MRIIEQHKILLEKAKVALTISSSADEMQSILDQVYTTIAANQKTTNDSCQYSSIDSTLIHNEPTSENGEREFLAEYH
ncbi:unnamed protein product [Rotaria sordida]|uniref:Uncharacterized protein n=1 Tax=Rotaria sordida TaxID=392033 RepID=A0A815B0S2_9BILA|nr:unnamed protein product [Rotaria sordida]CAF1543919.1 unnamed protein product [Rotaria sordida]